MEPEGNNIKDKINYAIINGQDLKNIIKGNFVFIRFTERSFEIIGDKNPSVGKNSKSEGAVFIKIPKDKLEGGKNKILVGVYSKGKLITKVKKTFFGPIK